MRSIWVVGRSEEEARQLAGEAGLPEPEVFFTSREALPAIYPHLPGARFILVDWPAERAIAVRTLPTLTHLTEVEILAVVEDSR